MKQSRRDFLKISAAVAGSLLPASALGGEATAVQNGEGGYGVLVDTVVCIGCRKCEWACNEENQPVKRPPIEYEDRSVFQRHRRPDDTAYTVVNQFIDPANPDQPHPIKVQCMHCVDPACVSACIVGALRKDSRGPVVYDAWKCIGCRYCMVACPFQVPTYEYNNPLNPEVKKCTFCYDRIINRALKPACVEICPNEALTFGPRGELLDAAYGRIRQQPDRYVNHVYGEFEVGGTSWMYLAPVDFTLTELPRLGREPIAHATERIQHGVFKFFIPPLALYGLLGMIMHSAHDQDRREGGHERA